MLRPAFTLDYEIHGNGDGCPLELMVEPTDRLLRLLDEYGAKLTIMADVAEILRFREYKQTTGRDRYYYDAIAAQLRRAVATGHDVQLHIHSSYFNATHSSDGWAQDWSEYNFAGLPYERMDWMVKTGKMFLEELLRPVEPDYVCVAFRAANWSASPSRNLVRVLSGNGITVDSSVFKYGRREGLVTFDYSHAHSSLLPWRASEDDICVPDSNSPVWELPIYSERRWIGAFLTAGRVYRVLAGLPHRVRKPSSVKLGVEGVHPPPPVARRSQLHKLFERHAWKADFNQCSGRQLVGALRRAADSHSVSPDVSLPFVLIGHSKLATTQNERSLRPFLAHVRRNPDRYAFDTLRGLSRLQSRWNTI